MEFKSQICTTREQSERLVAMGLKPETADMMWDAITIIRGRPVQEPMWSLRPYYYPKKSSVLYDNEEQVFIPAWSMYRLIEMMEVEFQSDGNDMWLRDGVCLQGDNLFDKIIHCIERLIKEGFFNEAYLVDQEVIAERCKGVMEYLDYIRGEEE